MSEYQGTKGTVGILNVGAGDTKLSFDKNNPAERIRAARIVKDMLRRGYALLVEIEVDGTKKFVRAKDFDENVCEYLIADFDPITAAEHDEEEVAHGQQAEAPAHAEEAVAPGNAKNHTRTRRIVTKRIDAEGARAVAVARTAGG